MGEGGAVEAEEGEGGGGGREETMMTSPYITTHYYFSQLRASTGKRRSGGPWPAIQPHSARLGSARLGSAPARLGGHGL